MSRREAGLSLLLGAILAPALSADVHLIRRADGSALIFNDIGSGWRVGGRAPSDSYLLTRRNAVTPFEELIRDHASREGVDPALVKCVMLVESNYNPRAVSRKGARGLMQLMPETARRYGVKNSFDVSENIRGGAAYLSDLLTLFRGDVALALAGYNAGEGAVTRHAGVPPYAETQEYIRRTMLVYRGAPSSRLLGGSFKGAEMKPAVAREEGAGTRSLAALARPGARLGSVATPVRVVRADGAVFISNVAIRRPDPPLLGRVQ